MPPSLKIEAFFHEPSYTVSYLVWDQTTRRAAIIDGVLDFDHSSGRTATHTARAILDAVKSNDLNVDWILETHAHADHLTAAQFLKQAAGAPIATGAHVREVQAVFKRIFNLEELIPDGRAFDRLLADGDRLPLGELEIEVLHTPGHTPSCVCFKIADAVFVGDTLFMPDYGVARCDFPGGDARTLYRSIRRLLTLPDETRLFMCHDYKAPGRSHFAWESTVADQRARNVHMREGVLEDEFVAMREARDKTLSMPALILPAIQINIRAGQLPAPEANGVRYLKLPLDAF